MRSKYSIGIDLGGTKISAAIVDNKGKILHSLRRPTRAHDFPQVKAAQKYLRQALVELIVQLINDCKPKKVHGIGISAAGPLDIVSGTLIHPTNFPGWKVFPLVEFLRLDLRKNKINIPIAIQNDAMAAAIGEGWTGAARGKQNYAVITIGTGVGTGVIHRGEPTQFKGMGGEWGHQLISLPDLAYLEEKSPAHPGGAHHAFSIEGYLSGTGIMAKAKAQNLSASSLEELLEKYKNDPRLQAIFSHAGLALGILCYNLSLGLRLEKILIGGGMAKIHSLYLPQAKSFYAHAIKERPGFHAQIGLASLGNSAGLVGAARLLYS